MTGDPTALPGVEGLPAAAFRADPGPLLSPWIQGATKPGASADPFVVLVCVGSP